MPASKPISQIPCVFLVCDANEAAALRGHFSEAMPQGPIELVVDNGGDEAVARFFARRPDVVVVTATLTAGDPRSMLDTLRANTPRGQLGVVLIGDANGPVRTALDALDFAVDRFVARPISAKSLRFAVGQCLELVQQSRSATVAPSPAPIVPIRSSEPVLPEVQGAAALPALPGLGAAWKPGDTAALGPASDGWDTPLPPPLEPAQREPTLVINPLAPAPRAPESDEAEALPMAERTGNAGESWTITPVRPVPEVFVDAPRPVTEVVAPVALDAPRPVTEVVAPVALDAPVAAPAAPDAEISTDVPPPRSGGRDFARELREKMSRMADRLFAQPGSGPVDVSPRHSHETEIDIGAFAEEPQLPGHATEIAAPSDALSTGNTTPGGWSEAARERTGAAPVEIALGTNDAVNLIARCYRQSFTGRLVFRHERNELVLFFDAGRLVFASSNQPLDRMGAMLCREGKITRAQFAQCDQQVGKSGRRTGETLVDLGFLKRRELLPAVRRHLEDVLFAAFSWRVGTFVVVADELASTERIRISRSVPALVVEGIRRKYDADTLARIGVTASAVLELGDRDKCATVLAAMDVPAGERTAISEADGATELGQLARKAGSDFVGVASVAYGLAVLGIATLRRGVNPDDEPELEETHALIGETDIAIDRARVIGRCQLVAESDYFAILGVRRDASGFEIRRAFDAARRDFAPEIFPAELRRELAREIATISHVLEEAFWVLRDDHLRASYVRHLVDRVDAMDRI